MPRSIRLLPLTVVFLALAGCTREAVRDMGSLKDDRYEAAVVRASKTAEGVTADKASVTKSAGAEDDEDDDKKIETGSISKDEAECQGEHIAYQATREYLKNFGPRPPDLPGEKGPCRKGE